MFLKKTKSKAFWQDVRTNPKYQAWIKSLLEQYEKYKETEISEISFDAFMQFHRNGKRVAFEAAFDPRRRRLSISALLALIFPEREEYLADLQNTIWAICGEYCWALPNHTPDSAFRYNDDHIDICAAIIGTELSEICYLLEDRLEPVVQERIHKEIDKRIIRSYMANTFEWETKTNNWSAVCTGNVAITFMYERPDLYPVIKPRIDASIACFLSGFKADGACREGIGYWEYGFGNFVSYAQHLYEFTDGKENLFQNKLVKNVAGFPNVAYLEKDVIVSFADCDKTARASKGVIGILQKHYGKEYLNLPENGLSEKKDIFSKAILTFEFFEPEHEDIQAIHEKEYFLPDSQIFVKKYPAYSFAAKGGDNKEPHNHNDVGSFIISSGSRQLLADIGRGEYTKDYFEHTKDKRYQILCTRSGGHSVPIINDTEQAYGIQYHGSMQYEAGRLVLELAEAYPVEELISLERSFTFHEDRVYLKDAFTFDKPCTILERFVSFICPDVSCGCVKLGDLYMYYDDSAWEVSVSKAVHTTTARVKEQVYLIDFTPCNPDTVLFEMEMRICA